MSLGEFSDSFSSDEDVRPSNPLVLRERVLTNSKGLRDFRVKSLKGASFGRKMIGIAEQGGCGLEEGRIIVGNVEHLHSTHIVYEWTSFYYCFHFVVFCLSEMPGLKVLIVWWFTVRDAWSEGSYCLLVYCQRCLV